VRQVVHRPNPVVAANWLRRCYTQGTYPVSTVGIAKRLNITIEYADLPLDRPGFARKLPDDSFIIWVNRHDSRERQNWTIAHELGHWTMHRYMQSDFASSPDDHGLYEREANAFAASLLMPERVVRALAPQMSFGGLAAYFGVSLSAMDVRLRELDVECA
jgi:Zn-dependent peptidase ImmA (M78 family)